MRDCELCDCPARLFCESDQASLCWDCDTKVHSANFLVARHSRNLLCNVCQSPTPWRASGANLGPTFSVCDSCAARCDGSKPIRERHRRAEEEGAGRENNQVEEDGDLIDRGEDVDDSDDADSDDEEDLEEEEGDNQVVPWSLTPPPMPSSSSSDDSSSRDRSAS